MEEMAVAAPAVVDFLLSHLWLQEQQVCLLVHLPPAGGAQSRFMGGKIQFCLYDWRPGAEVVWQLLPSPAPGHPMCRLEEEVLHTAA